MTTEQEYQYHQIQQRREQFQREMQPYQDALVKILHRMPVAGCAIDMETRTFTMLPPPTNWAKAIQNILDARDAHIRERFPEIKFSGTIS